MWKSCPQTYFCFASQSVDSIWMASCNIRLTRRDKALKHLSALVMYPSQSARFWLLLLGSSMLSPRLPETCDLSSSSFSCRLFLPLLVKPSFVRQLHLVVHIHRNSMMLFFSSLWFGIAELWAYFLSSLGLPFGILSVTLISVRTSWTTCPKVFSFQRNYKCGIIINVLIFMFCPCSHLFEGHCGIEFRILPCPSHNPSTMPRAKQQGCRSPN